jgi:hypothetical protein
VFIRIKNCKNCDMPHEWDFDSPGLKELRTIKELTGLNGMSFADQMASSDPDALTALLYILHKRLNITVQFDDVDLDFSDFEMEETEEEKKLREEAEKADAKKARETTRSGRTRKAV